MNNLPQNIDISQRSTIVCAALLWLGTPYQHQASSLGQGCDCLGLIRGVWRMLYGRETYRIPPYTPNWSDYHDKETLLHGAQRYLVPSSEKMTLPGDVMIFRMASKGAAKHCGLYLGDGRFIHAYSGQAVVSARYSQFWQRRIAAVFSFPKIP